MTQTQKYSIIAKSYAQALIELVKSDKLSYDKIESGFSTIKFILNQSPDLNEFLINPITSIEDKKEILDKVFTSEIDGLLLNFLKVLVDKNRFIIFDEILISYNTIIDKINNISRVNVISAVDLSQEAKNKLKQKLEQKLQKNVSFSWEVNPEIIAGLVIKMGDNVIDTSLKTKFEDLSKNII